LTERYDVAIVGGGPVGAALALAMHGTGMSTIVLEARERQSPADGFRPLALSYGSRLILERIGVWQALESATPIGTVHVSQRRRPGIAVLTAIEAGLPHLGYVTDYSTLASALNDAMGAARLELIRGARVASIAHDPVSARVEFSVGGDTRDCIASVIAIADGSALAADIQVRTIDYRQSAVTACVATELPHRNVAHERFSKQGPIGLLPYGDKCALVWTTTTNEARELESVSPAGFLSALQSRFGDRLGRFTEVTRRASQALVLRVAEHGTWGRAAIIGNAAQALHPVAGQGLNLGLRDAWELAGELRRRGASDAHVLDAYRTRRRVDRRGTIAFTNALISIFSNDVMPLAMARGVGLMCLDCAPLVKDVVVRRMIFGARG
jgi:2-octaprenyl-6-methoxyphenol hydroxylase